MTCELYPGYNVLSKRWTLSWNQKTREIIDRRLALSREPRFFTASEFDLLNAICDRIIPKPKDRPPAPLAAFVDEKMADRVLDGYRYAQLPPQEIAWRCGLAAFESETQQRYETTFSQLSPDHQDHLLRLMQKGELTGEDWHGMPSDVFFEHRVIADITHAYYSHPVAWSEIGYGGPASLRAYVRMGLNRRDPWEAVETKEGSEASIRKVNQREGGRRQHSPFRHGLAAVSPGMVQIAQRIGIWRRLADRLARNVVLLHKG